MRAEVELNLVEVFWSAQGEGPQVGRSTVFVRFGACDLRCGWCDSPETWKAARQCRFEVDPGSGEFESEPNPTSAGRLRRAIEALAPRPGSLLSLTGGEPLLQPPGVVAAARIGHDLGLKVAIETHGLAVEALNEVIDEIDYVSMDWKLESDVRWAESSAVGPDFQTGHRAFLERIRESALPASVKVVITRNSKPEELAEVCRGIASIAPDIPLILQPVTPHGRVREQPSAKALLGHLRRCEDQVAEVRLIPQTHRVYGAL